MKIFVTGGHGFLGTYLLPLLRDKGHEIIAPSHKEFDIVIDPWGAIDDGVFEDIDMVINLAAYTDVAKAEIEPAEAEAVNTSVEWLLELPTTCQIYHMSTDYVYNGNEPCSGEGDMMEPFNRYGKSKAMADALLLADCNPRVHIIRTSFKPMVWPHPVAPTNMLTNADTVDVMSHKIAEFILADTPGGVYNIGTKWKSMYQLAYSTNHNVRPCKVEEFPILRRNVTMNLAKYECIMHRRI